jgi:ribosomal protein S18 acetylase RimI-like enzyme
MSIEFAIADRGSNADALTELFSASLTASYISHSELQGGRALAPGQWAPDIKAILHREIDSRLREPLKAFPKRDWFGVVQAFDDGALVGLAFVTVTGSAPTPYGVIEDIVIDSARRKAGFGEKFMRWILDAFAQAGIRRTFLESGITNDRAHHLFERLGFKKTSIVMMRDG